MIFRLSIFAAMAGAVWFAYGAVDRRLDVSRYSSCIASVVGHVGDRDAAAMCGRRAGLDEVYMGRYSNVAGDTLTLAMRDRPDFGFGG